MTCLVALAGLVFCAAAQTAQKAVVKKEVVPPSAANRSRYLFVAGLPRSGTTLVHDFVRRHNGVMTEKFQRGDTEEWKPKGSLGYGGSGGCLEPMCGKKGYVSRARRDTKRHDVLNYLNALPPAARRDGTLKLDKDPANTLNIGEMLKSCALRGIDCRFLVVVKAPLEWEAKQYGCSGSCRTKIAANAARCLDYAVRSFNGSEAVRVVKFEAAGDVGTWRAIERWLGLAPIPVMVTYAPSPGRRELVIHGEARGEPFHVDTKYLRPVCAKAPSVAFPEKLARELAAHDIQRVP